jgi:uncharacterized membrane protein
MNKKPRSAPRSDYEEWPSIFDGKHIIVYALRFGLAVLAAVAAYAAAEFWALRTWDVNESHVVEIMEIGREIEREPEEDAPFRTVDVELVIRSLTGEHKGKNFSIVASQMEDSGLKLKRGRNYILISDVFEDGSAQHSLSDVLRIPSVVSVIVLVCACLMAFAGRAGAMALLGLGLSIACLLWGFVPLAAKGVTPVPLAFLAVFIISLVTVFCVVRRKQARAVALMGTLGGVAGAFALGYSMAELWQLSGLAGETASLLVTTIAGMDIRGILLASVMIGAVGVVLDVGISITAAMSELAEYDSRIGLSRLWAAGIRIGSEVLGSMINTLILAYLSTSLPMALLISNAGANLVGLINDPYVCQEIVQSLAGTTGLILTIPITATFFIFQEKLSRRRRASAVMRGIRERDL